MYTYEYEQDTGNVDVRNVTGFWDKKNYTLNVSFEAKIRKEEHTTSTACTVYLRQGVDTLSTMIISSNNGSAGSASMTPAPENTWIKYEFNYEPYSIDLVDNGATTFNLLFRDEHNTVVHSEGFTVDYDLDPAEHSLKIRSADFGQKGDGTGGTDDQAWIEFTVGDLPFEQEMTPSLKKYNQGVFESGGSGVLHIELLNDDGSPYWTNVGASGIVNLNGVKFSKSSLPFGTSKTAYWRRLNGYKMQFSVTSQLREVQEYDIKLQCTNV